VTIERKELRRLVAEIVEEEQDAERACFQLADALEEWGELLVVASMEQTQMSAEEAGAVRKGEGALREVLRECDQTPMSHPTMVECPRCHGDGGWYVRFGPDDNYDLETCPDCRGTGEQPPKTPTSSREDV